jgi:hypothetical protein
MFVCIAVAVSLFVYAAVSVSRWKYMKSEAFATDRVTTEYINEQMNLYRPTYAILLVAGIALCIISVIPPILTDAIPDSYIDFAESLAAGMLFILVAVGVFLIVKSSLTIGIYRRLLSLNDKETVCGNYVSGQKEQIVYDHKTVAAVMSVFWQTVTCLYLCISFISFKWGVTWLIWPIAAVIYSLIKNLCGHR